MFRHALPLCLLTGLVAPPAAALEGFHFSHGDWEIACDNTRTCRAAGYQVDGDEMPVSVLLVRKAGPDEPVVAQLQLGEPYDEAATPRPASVRLVIDGRELGTVRVDDSLQPAQVDALLAALRRDSDIAFVAGAQRWSLSDAGAAAVLLKMDEAQGRIGTPGALVRKGKRAEATVSPALPAPVVVPVPLLAKEDARLAADPALLRAIARAMQRDECELPEHMNAAMRGLTVRQLDRDRLLVSSLCWTAAYNTGDAYWIVDASPPHAATLVTISAIGFEDGVINEYQKGRGIGDCIGEGTWTWDGRTFVRTGEQTSGLCKGFPGGAWKLPTLVTEGMPAQ
jgi:hypothetical protein